MGSLFRLTFETNNLSGTADSFDSVVGNGDGDMAVAAGAALHGSAYGVSVLINSLTPIYGIKAFTTSTRIRTGFYFKRNTLTAGTTPREIELLRVIRSTGTVVLQVFFVVEAGPVYKIYITAREDDLSWHTSASYMINDSEHGIEVDLLFGAGTGYATLRIDGVIQETLPALDNNDFDAASAWLGAEDVGSASFSGTFYIDEFCGNDDGSSVWDQTRLLRAIEKY